MHVVIFDTETTGLLSPSCAKEQPRIIEVGALKIDSKSDICDELSQLINPEIEIQKNITKITGINQQAVEGQPTFKEFFPKFEEFFEGVNVLICHNASFDVGMVNAELKRNGLSFKFPETIVCTALEYQHVFGGYVKLKDMYKHFLGVELDQKHRALEDCIAVYEILKSQEQYNIIGK